MREDLKIIGFAATVCVVCSLILSTAYSALRDQQVANVKLDQKFNVLKALGVPVSDEKGKKIMPPEEITRIFGENVTGYVLDENGEKLDGVDPSSLTDAEVAKSGKNRYPIFLYNDPDTGDRNVAMHISGKGLWSTLKGYIAVGPDLATIVGITFYDHGETPGLGGEIDKAWFQNNFKGKTLFDGDAALPFEVVKGKVAEVAVDRSDYSVDGIPGSTMTCKGLTKFLQKDMLVYNKHLIALRAE